MEAKWRKENAVYRDFARAIVGKLNRDDYRALRKVLDGVEPKSRHLLNAHISIEFNKNRRTPVVY